VSQIWRVEPKQPSEVRPIAIDWSPALDAGESFSTLSLLAIVDRESGADATLAMYVVGSLVASGNTIAFRVQAGSDNRDYVATVHVMTTRSRIEDGKVIIPVRARTRQ